MRDTAKGSKLLSLVLRHRPELVGIELDERGWVPVPTLLEGLAARGRPMARAELDEMVRCNEKQRFELDAAADRIRARQAHSVPLDLALAPVDPPAVLFHGTPVGNLGSIHADGLDRRRRHHVHLSPDPVTAHQVGARRGRPVVLAVDAAAMAAAGHRFWRTANGVWLTDGVPPQYIAVAHGPPPVPDGGVRLSPEG